MGGCFYFLQRICRGVFSFTAVHFCKILINLIRSGLMYRSSPAEAKKLSGAILTPRKRTLPENFSRLGTSQNITDRRAAK